MDTGMKINSYLKARGIKQTWLARRCGIGVSKMNMALSGKRRLTLQEYELICWALDVGAEMFLCPHPPC